MVNITLRERKGPILTPSSIPCLNHLPTINITEGCALGCAYCYIQGYSHYPGDDRVILFANTAQLVRDELAGKRKLPRRVYFSPSSDAFQFLPEVQDVAYETMDVLLNAGVEIAFLTKGFVTDRFLSLFARYSQYIFAQVGITTLETTLWRVLEPRTAPPRQRLATIRNLVSAGVATTARLDPLIPDLTDTHSNLRPLLGALRETGMNRAAASYLFLRPAFAKVLLAKLSEIDSSLAFTAEQWRYGEFQPGAGGGRMIDEAERAARFAAINTLAEDFGIQLDICACKNPRYEGSKCQIAGPESISAIPHAETESSLFPGCKSME